MFSKENLFFSLKSEPLHQFRLSHRLCENIADLQLITTQHWLKYLTSRLHPKSQPSSTLHPTRRSHPRSHLRTPQNVTMTLEAHNPLGHGSNQVHRSLTYMWHLRTLLTLMHRLLEPFSLTFGVISPILGDVSNDLTSRFLLIILREIHILTKGTIPASCGCHHSFQPLLWISLVAHHMTYVWTDQWQEAYVCMGLSPREWC